MSTTRPPCPWTPWTDDRPRPLGEAAPDGDLGGYLDDYLDGDLPESAQRRVEEHLAVCARCRRDLADLEALVEEARGLRAAVEPPRDLWPGIAARLTPRPARRNRAAARRPARALPWLPLAAAAVLLLALAGTLVLREWSPGAAPAETETALGASPAPGRALSRQVLAALERQQGNLSPATVSSLEGSLAALDRSIADLRAALASDPGNRQLHLWLAERYRQELELLQRLQLLEVPPRPRS